MAHTEHPPIQSSEAAASPAAVGAAQARVIAPDPALAEALAKGYEPHDIGLRGVVVFVIGLATVLLVVLAAIYGITMALADYDRSLDPLSSPITVTKAPMYAPLQPSREHDVLDQDDMREMRERVNAALEGGVTPAGRRTLGIATAINQIVESKLLPVKPVVAAIEQPLNPPGTFEGYTPATTAGTATTAPSTGPAPVGGTNTEASVDAH